EVQTPDAGRVPVVVGKFDLELYIRRLLASRAAIAHLPSLFAAMKSGDFSELAIASVGWRTTFTPPASIFAMRCASSASPGRDARISREAPPSLFRDLTDLAEERVCRAWGVEPLPEEFREPVRSSLPILVVSGTLDGIAPESNAAEVLRGFPAGRHLRVAGAAHLGLGYEDLATRSAIVRFFDGSRPGSLQVALPSLVFERAVPTRQPVFTALARGGGGTEPSMVSLFWSP